MTLCFVVPGLSLTFSGQKKAAIAVPLLGLFWVLLFSATRWVVTPYGFSTMILGLALWHLTTYIYGFIYTEKKPNTKSAMLTILVTIIVLNLSITLLSHYYKTRIFGFGFYYIKSNSMQPTLMPNDVIVVDTWAKMQRSITIKDIVIFRDAKRQIEIVKRVERIRNNERQEFYVLGDNPRHSMDSRHYSWINESQLTAKACFILYSFSNKTHSLTTL